MQDSEVSHISKLKVIKELSNTIICLQAIFFGCIYWMAFIFILLINRCLRFYISVAKSLLQ